MNSESQFEDYLGRIEDDLLECVAADFAGLGQLFRNEEPGAEFARRREACHAECIRRRRPELYRRAEDMLHTAA